MEFRTFVVAAKVTGFRICPDSFAIADGRTLTKKKLFENTSSFFDIQDLNSFVSMPSYDICQSCFENISTIRYESGPNAGYRRQPSVLTDVMVLLPLEENPLGMLHNRSHQLSNLVTGLFGLSPLKDFTSMYVALNKQLTPSLDLIHAAQRVQSKMFSFHESFACMHWRFEEQKCKRLGVGLCFPTVIKAENKISLMSFSMEALVGAIMEVILLARKYKNLTRICHPKLYVLPSNSFYSCDQFA